MINASLRLLNLLNLILDILMAVFWCVILVLYIFTDYEPSKVTVCAGFFISAVFFIRLAIEDYSK